jgi:hypothetical protein
MTVAWYRWDGEALVLSLHVQPRAKQDRVEGTHGDRLKIRIKAPPVEGKANRYLLAFLADCFGVPSHQAALTAGEGSRDKRVTIQRPARYPEWFPEAARRHNPLLRRRRAGA